LTGKKDISEIILSDIGLPWLEVKTTSSHATLRFAAPRKASLARKIVLPRPTSIVAGRGMDIFGESGQVRKQNFEQLPRQFIGFLLVGDQVLLE